MNTCWVEPRCQNHINVAEEFRHVYTLKDRKRERERVGNGCMNLLNYCEGIKYKDEGIFAMDGYVNYYKELIPISKCLLAAPYPPDHI